jgi:hypothetical protein
MKDQDFPTIKKQISKHIPEFIEWFCYDYDEIDTPMYLWIELNFFFQEMVKHQNENVIQKIFEEAIFQLEFQEIPNNYNTAVALAFFEHLLENENNFQYIVSYLPKKYFIKYEFNFKYFSSTKEKYDQVLKMYNDFSNSLKKHNNKKKQDRRKKRK